MKKRNNLYTLSYFRKRLKDAGIYAKILVENYDENDRRYWTISISEELNIICTCFKYLDEDDSQIVNFHFNDGGQRFTYEKIIQTESMNVIIEILSKVINT